MNVTSDSNVEFRGLENEFPVSSHLNNVKLAEIKG